MSHQKDWDVALRATQELLAAIETVHRQRDRRALAWSRLHAAGVTYPAMSAHLLGELEAMGWTREQIKLVGITRYNIRRVVT